MSKVTPVGDAAREYCQKYPKASSALLARMLRKDFPELYSTDESARSAVRYHRGARHAGTGKRAKGVLPREPLNLPESDAVELPPVPFTSRGFGTVISDVHIPYHDLRALTAAMTHAREQKATDFLLINGDLLDFYQLSQWEKDPRCRHFADELERGRQFLRVACEMFGQVWYKFGNHEYRYDRYMLAKAPELLELPNMRLQDILRSRQDEAPDPVLSRIKFIEHNLRIKAAALTILHGHEYGKGLQNPVNPARGMFNKAIACTLSGHLHQTSHHVSPTIEDRQISCWSLGCLCGLNPTYAVLNKWNHGFALMSYDGKSFDIQNLRILEGRVY